MILTIREKRIVKSRDFYGVAIGRCSGVDTCNLQSEVVGGSKSRFKIQTPKWDGRVEKRVTRSFAFLTFSDHLGIIDNIESPSSATSIALKIQYFAIVGSQNARSLSTLLSQSSSLVLDSRTLSVSESILVSLPEVNCIIKEGYIGDYNMGLSPQSRLVFQVLVALKQLVPGSKRLPLYCSTWSDQMFRTNFDC